MSARLDEAAWEASARASVVVGPLIGEQLDREYAQARRGQRAGLVAGAVEPPQPRVGVRHVVAALVAAGVVLGGLLAVVL